MACTPGSRLSVCMSEPLKFSSMNRLSALITLREDFICISLLELPLTTTSPRDTPSLIIRLTLSATTHSFTESSGKETAVALDSSA